MWCFAQSKVVIREKKKMKKRCCIAQHTFLFSVRDRTLWPQTADRHQVELMVMENKREKFSSGSIVEYRSNY